MNKFQVNNADVYTDLMRESVYARVRGNYLKRNTTYPDLVATMRYEQPLC